VLVLRRVAAADVPASEAEAQVDPGVAGFEALFATARVRLDVVDLVEVGADWHGCPFFSEGAGSFRANIRRAGSGALQV
jgi:hypothetical protein